MFQAARISTRHQLGQAKVLSQCFALQRTRELLYLMFKAGYVSLQDIPRDKDHAPSRTIYTWRANNDVAIGQMGGDIYKSALNTRLFYEHHIEANKQVSPKSARMYHMALPMEMLGPCQCTLRPPGADGILRAPILAFPAVQGGVVTCPRLNAHQLLSLCLIYCRRHGQHTNREALLPCS